MKASEKAEITVWEFLDELDRRKISLNVFNVSMEAMDALEKSPGL